MARMATGIALGTLAIYFWGFLYWGIVGVQKFVWKSPTDDVAAQNALLTMFPSEGTYYVPGVANLDWEKLMNTGPIAFVHVLDRDGRPIVDTGIMLKGFVLYLMTVSVLALLLRTALPALPTFSARLRLVFLAGLASTLLVDMGEHVWWVMPLDWKLVQAIYNMGAWIIAGAVLAAFLKPGEQGQSGAPNA